MKDALIVLSGGLDSTTMLYEYQYRIGMAVSFHYGSNHNDRELEFAKLHCERLGIPHLVIRLPFIKQFFKSSLLEGADAIPEGNYDEQNMKSTVVPFRNGIMLSIAAGIAENNKMQYVMLANHAGDHAIYPDCREESVNMARELFRISNWDSELVEYNAPFVNYTKSEVLGKGLDAMKALGLTKTQTGKVLKNTMSCYNATPDGKACGKCGTCTERIEAFRDNGIEDPIQYV